LIAVLLGIDPLEVPANATLQFTHGKILNTAKLVQATLVAKGYLPVMSPEQIKTVLKRFSKYEPPTTGMALNPAKQEELSRYLDQGDSPAPKAVEEIPITNTEHDLYREAVSMVMAERRYFVKRIVRQDGTPLLTATAWSLEGPWNVTSSNPIACASVGLEEGAA
jgi:hypothetical protein